ncbi:hypothetical protein HYH02_013100 [Chlamydomonas schloesseri]|uniref:Uncharacterized protein n=1 Tax=Chlamydomonas schloesseri TaxID=2026947 RepID=A0A835T3Y5_9CHLO|nr:hypothetical protein HYH02_013100 [Chlamydomonas schloesseri]|eukprot:KAG2432030.1 hypothetical protein HYH02_013100 [Chlamydomonas schloesseri]
MEQGGSKSGQAAGQGASSAADAQDAVAGTSSRSPGKVAFSDRNDEYKYRSSRRRGDGSSSESSTSSGSSSSSSSDSSDERSRRKRGGKGSSSSSSGGGGRRNGTSRDTDRERDRRDDRRSEPPRDRRGSSHHRDSELANSGSQHHTSSSSTYRVTSPAPGSYPPGLPPPHPYPPGLGPGMLSSAVPGNMPSPVLTPPPGTQFGPYSPAGTPTKAYTSPRSAQGPAPTLLMSQPPPVAYATSMAPPPQPQPPPPQQLTAPPPPAQLPPAAYPGASALLDPLHALSLQAGAAQLQQHQPPPPPQQQVLLQLPPVPHHALQQLGPGGAVLGLGGQPLSLLYDDTTQEVVYADDVMARELAKQGHALLPLGDAYRGKLAALQAAVNGQLLAKREALLQQHARLAARAGEVAAARAGLEREVSALAEDMLGKVRSAESLKQALLGREQAEVDGQLDAIGRLLTDVVSASAAGPVDFLNAYRRLADTCDRLVARPFKSEVDVAADDLPAEAGVYRQLAEAHGALAKLLAVKDQMIAHLLQERDAMQEELSQVVERYGSELAALEAQAEGYYRRLQALGAAGAEGGEEAAAAGSRRGTQGG